MLFLLHPINLPLIQWLVEPAVDHGQTQWASKSAKNRRDKSNSGTQQYNSPQWTDRLWTKKGCVECCYAHSWMQICVASVGKYTALIPRTVRLLFSTCNCERGGRSRERERQKKTKGIRSLLSKQCPCQSEHFPMEVLHLHFELLVNSLTRDRLDHRASEVNKKWDSLD